MLLFVPPERQTAVREQLCQLINVPFKFDFSGSQIIFFDQENDYSAIDQLRAHQTIRAFRELADCAPNP